MTKHYIRQPISEWEAIHSLLVAIFSYKNMIIGIEPDYIMLDFVNSL